MTVWPAGAGPFSGVYEVESFRLCCSSLQFLVAMRMYMMRTYTEARFLPGHVRALDSDNRLRVSINHGLHRDKR